MSASEHIAPKRAIARLVTLALIGVGVLAAAGFGTVIMTYRHFDGGSALLIDEAINNHRRALHLAVAEKDMELDVTRIQEIAEDTGDVGNDPAFADDVKENYAEIAAMADQFKVHAAQARAIGVALNDTGMLRVIDAMSAAVPKLRDAALRMAHAYVDSGRDAGNALMRPFDAEADRLKELAQSVHKSVDGVIAHARGEILGAEAARDSGQSTALMVSAIVVLIMLGACGGLIVLFQRKLLQPIRRMTEAMGRLARHDVEAPIEGLGRADEIGDMAAALNVFKDNMIEGDRLKAEQEAERRRALAKNEKLEELSRGFEARVGEIVQSVAAQAEQMQSSAQEMTATADETTRQAGTVAAASEQSAANVQTVAAAAEELSSSIAEISRQVGHSSRIAHNAVDEAGNANQMVKGLAGASQKIGEIVAMINEIADQTNLLALNATIEAARAGEAGKGFAVVASEVKNLATQTSRATEEIRTQITGVQSATQDAVRAIDTIGSTIGEISEIVTTIAAAVEEQGAATREIARNVEETAKGTREVSANIGGVTQAANSTGSAAGQVLQAARILSGQSGDLRRHVVEFLGAVKAS